MRADVYNDIKTMLQNISGINRVAYYTDQLDKLRDFIGKPPFLLFEIRNLEYQTETGSAQVCEGFNLVLHFIGNNFNNDMSKALNLSQSTYAQIQKNGFSRLREDFKSMGELFDLTVTYKAPNFRDDSVSEFNTNKATTKSEFNIQN
jgi:hypothetical protein